MRKSTRKPILWLTSGMILGGIITSSTAVVAGPLQVAISQIKLMVNGADKTPTGGSYWNGSAQVPLAFEYQGTTYMPIRYISESLGLPVNWEGTTRTITVGANSATQPVVYNGDPLHPEPSSSVTFTPLGSVLYDAGDSNIIKVSIAVRNDDTKTFNVGAYQSNFISKEGVEFTGSLYLPQGSSNEIDPKTTRILEYYATVPKGSDGSDYSLQLTKIDFNIYPAEFKAWATIPLGKSNTNGVSYMGYDTPTFDVAPYHIQIGSFAPWSYKASTTTQVYKFHVTTIKDPNVNAFPNTTNLIIEVVDGNGQSVTQTQYAVNSSSNSSIPVLNDGDQYITFNIDWSRYNDTGTKIRVWDVFGQGKRVLGTFNIN